MAFTGTYNVLTPASSFRPSQACCAAPRLHEIWVSTELLPQNNHCESFTTEKLLLKNGPLDTSSECPLAESRKGTKNPGSDWVGFFNQNSWVVLNPFPKIFGWKLFGAVKKNCINTQPRLGGSSFPASCWLERRGWLAGGSASSWWLSWWIPCPSHQPPFAEFSDIPFVSTQKIWDWRWVQNVR